MAKINNYTFVTNFNADDQNEGVELLTDERGHLYPLSQLFSGETLGDALKITPTSVASMSISITSGYVQIPFSDYSYQCWLDTDIEMVLDGADESLNRISTIVAYIDRNHMYETTVTNNPGLLYIAEIPGDNSANPEPPSDTQIQSIIGMDNPYITLAQIYVPANATIISLSNITDLRTAISLRRGLQLPEGSYASGVMQASGSMYEGPLKIAVINYGSNMPDADSKSDILVCELSR